MNDCPVCGKDYIFSDHRCNEKSLRAKEAANKRNEEKGIERKPYYLERLKEGFRLMNLSESEG
jgi:hypothetical protein